VVRLIDSMFILLLTLRCIHHLVKYIKVVYLLVLYPFAPISPPFHISDVTGDLNINLMAVCHNHIDGLYGCRNTDLVTLPDLRECKSTAVFVQHIYGHAQI